jgi:hypothetical protein
MSGVALAHASTPIEVSGRGNLPSVFMKDKFDIGRTVCVIFRRDQD